MWLDKKYFTDVVYRSQTSKKLGAKYFGPFKIIELVGKNAIGIELPPQIRAHYVVHVEHTKKFVSQPREIAAELPKVAHLQVEDKGEQVIDIGKILAHKKKWKTYYFLALPRNAPTHDAEWQPLEDIVNLHGTKTETLHVYPVKHKILTHLH